MLDTIWLALAAVGIAASSPQCVALALNGRMCELHRERQVRQAMRDLEIYDSALHAFKFHCDRYPTTEEGLGALTNQPLFRKGWKGPYVKSLTCDPWGHPYKYKRPGAH